MKVLVTCPPMLACGDDAFARLRDAGVEPVPAAVEQTLGEAELLTLVPTVDAWVIGDDPATAAVLRAGTDGLLRAAVKWGVGTDNVDLAAVAELDLAFTNTPGMFGREVADLAVAYLVSLLRHTREVDAAVRGGTWAKPAGTSLAGLPVVVVGHGDVGCNVVRRLDAADAEVRVVDPAASRADEPRLQPLSGALDDAGAVVVTCALTDSSRGLLDETALRRLRPGARVVNVSRGPVVDQHALVRLLRAGHLGGAALDVMEIEPPHDDDPLLGLPNVLLGSHNASNTREAVERTNDVVVDHLLAMLGRRP